jgi:arylsulfatase A-like enzyme
MLAVTVVRPPNFVVIFADDLGYGDLSCYGNREYRTPNLDRMAAEGVRFTNFYSASPGCSPSRAALLTGSYPVRVGVPQVLNPDSPTGLNPEESNLANTLKPLGYATACVGKWHLGVKNLMPTFQGFDTFYGLPYSNDMWPFHPEAKKGTYPDLPLIEGEKTIASNPDQAQLTRAYTERAVRFIERHPKQPFFLYLAHSMPHVPLFVSQKFQGKTARGLFGDVIEEIDWSVGEVMKALRAAGLERNTLVIFTSDNGPWLSYGNHAGSAGPFREGKGTVWEGGVREPCIMSWPGKIPAGTVSDEPAMTIDIFPTVAGLLGARLPQHPIDGKDIWPLISGQPGAKSPQEAYYFYYHANELLAVRSGPWKLLVPHSYRSLAGRPGGSNGIPAKYETLKTGRALYNLEKDPGETTDVSASHPEMVTRLESLLAKARADLGDQRAGMKGKGAREPGRVEE